MFITVSNDGPEIASTNYFDTEHARRGYYYLTLNAGAFRHLVPDSQVGEIGEWKSAREVIVSRGQWKNQGSRDAVEVLFEDGTDNPYAVHLVVEAVDRLPLPGDQDEPGQPPRWRFTAWTRNGKPLELPCRYRVVGEIPCLKPF